MRSGPRPAPGSETRRNSTQLDSSWNGYLVREADFLKSGINRRGGADPQFGIGIRQRCDLGVTQLEAVLAQAAKGRLGVSHELGAKLFVGYQPAYQHFDHSVRHNRRLSRATAGQTADRARAGRCQSLETVDFREAGAVARF
jgi:hypothetical protein